MSIEVCHDFDLALSEAGLSQEPYDERLDIHEDVVHVTRKSMRSDAIAHTAARKVSLPWSFPLCTSYMYLSRCNRENAPKIMSRLLGSSRRVFCYELYDKGGFGEKGDHQYAHDYLKFLTYHRFRLLWWSVRPRVVGRVAFVYSL